MNAFSRPTQFCAFQSKPCAHIVFDFDFAKEIILTAIIAAMLSNKF